MFSFILPILTNSTVNVFIIVDVFEPQAEWLCICRFMKLYILYKIYYLGSLQFFRLCYFFSCCCFLLLHIPVDVLVVVVVVVVCSCSCSCNCSCSTSYSCSCHCHCCCRCCYLQLLMQSGNYSLFHIKGIFGVTFFSNFSVHNPSITESKFGRPATDAYHLYETPVTRTSRAIFVVVVGRGLQQLHVLQLQLQMFLFMLLQGGNYKNLL